MVEFLIGMFIGIYTGMTLEAIMVVASKDSRKRDREEIEKEWNNKKNG